MVKDGRDTYIDVDDETEVEYIEKIEKLAQEYRRELHNLLYYLVEVKA